MRRFGFEMNGLRSGSPTSSKLKAGTICKPLSASKYLDADVFAQFHSIAIRRKSVHSQDTRRDEGISSTWVVTAITRVRDGDLVSVWYGVRHADSANNRINRCWGGLELGSGLQISKLASLVLVVRWSRKQANFEIATPDPSPRVIVTAIK